MLKTIHALILFIGLQLCMPIAYTYTKTADSLTINTLVNASVNPDLTGRASPIEIRFSLLKSDQRFKNSDFFALYDNGPETLSTDLISRSSLLFLPGKNKKIDLSYHKEAKYLCVLASFQDIDNAKWRDCIVINPDKNSVINLHVERLSVKLTTNDNK